MGRTATFPGIQRLAFQLLDLLQATKAQATKGDPLLALELHWFN